MTKSVLSALDSTSAECPSSLVSRRESLELRLHDGYARIDEAALTGIDVTEWETFWTRLLREYEGVCREMDIAA